MHPKLLLQACSDLVRLTLTFEHPADSVVSKFFRDNRKNYALGQRERALLAETVYNVLRYKLRYDHFAPSGSGPKERRLAILGFAQHLMDHSPTGAPLPGATPPPKRQEGASSRNRFVPKVHATSPIEFLKSALTEQEVVWVEACLKINVEDLLERHRHNLPEWMVDPLKAQVGEGFWPLVESLNKSAALDLRVNDWLAKREDVWQASR